MTERWHGWVMAIVALGHLGAAIWLSYAMVPLPVPRAAETVMYVELIEIADPPAPDPTPEPEASPPDVTPPPEPRRTPPPDPVVRLRRESVTMEAVIEPRSDPLSGPAMPREFIDPERDPFYRPPASTDQGFGRRRALPVLPDSNRPRIAGERPPDAPLPELRMGDTSPKRIVEAIGSFIGGGPNAPMEAPCGGRVNGGFGATTSFSPAWQKHYGCGDEKERAGYDGTVDQPPGTVR